MRGPSSRQGAVAAAAAAFALVGGCCVGVANAGCTPEMGEPALRYAATSNRIYVEGGCATIDDIMKYRQDVKGRQTGPIWHFDPVTNWYAANYTGTYYMESTIYVTNGSTLSIDGQEDPLVDECETLLLASNSSLFVDVVAHGGNLDIQHTKVSSWDLMAASEDVNTDDGRSSLKAITEKITGRPQDTCPDDPNNGNATYSSGAAKKDMGNAEMNIHYSEIAYLGYDASESYGISYKARGLCKDLSNEDIYDDDNGLDYGVTGSMTFSHVHHLWFGHYSWGHDGGVFDSNIVHDNYGYGFDPHDDSDYVQITNNTVYNNGWHGIIASKRCNNLLISGNHVYKNGKNGLMLHRSCDNATVTDNRSWNNGDAGLALFESSDCEVSGNYFLKNLQGVRFSNGANRNNVHDNVIRMTRSDSRYAFYMYQGNDDQQAEGNLDGHIKDNNVYENTVFSPKSDIVVYAKEADNNVFENNVFKNGLSTRWANATENAFVGNTLPANFSLLLDDGTVCFKDTIGQQLLPLCA